MKQSFLFTKTKKESPADEVSLNAELLIKAGFINKEMRVPYCALLFFLVHDTHCPCLFQLEDHAPAPSMLALLAWMSLWWLTEAIPVALTALLPAAMLPIMGILSAKQARLIPSFCWGARCHGRRNGMASGLPCN